MESDKFKCWVRVQDLVSRHPIDCILNQSSEGDAFGVKRWGTGGMDSKLGCGFGGSCEDKGTTSFMWLLAGESTNFNVELEYESLQRAMVPTF